MQENENVEITIVRPTGPRVTFASPQSIGELVAYKAGRSVGAFKKNALGFLAFGKKHRRSIATFAATVLLTVCVDLASTVITKKSLAMFPFGAKFFDNSAAQTVSSNNYTGPCNVAGITCIAYWGLRGAASSYNGKVVNLCDLGGINCADVLATSGVVGALANGIGACNNSTNVCTVHTFYEQIGTLNCSGSCDATESPGANLVISYSGAAPAISCGGGSLSTPSLSVALNQPFTFSVVAAQTSYIARAYISGQLSNVQLGYSAANTSIEYAGGAITAATIDNQLQAIQFVFNGNSSGSAIYVDGTNTTGNAGTTGLASGSGVSICDAWGQGQPLIGHLSEVLITNSSSASQTLCRNQQSYFNTVSNAC